VTGVQTCALPILHYEIIFFERKQEFGVTFYKTVQPGKCNILIVMPFVVPLVT